MRLKMWSGWEGAVRRHLVKSVANFKLLQQGFDKVGVSKHIEVEKLVKAKYQEL